MTYVPQYHRRALYARTNNNLLIGDPSMTILPTGWADAADSTTPSWWLGSDSGGGAFAIGPNGPWLDTTNSVLPAVTRCTGIVVDSIIRTPWRYSGPDGQILPRPLWVDDPQLIGRTPGPVGPVLPAGLRLDGHSFWATWLTHALWWGLGAFIFAEASDGTPLPGSLRIMNPYLVGVDDDGHLLIDPNGQYPVRTDFGGRFILSGRIWRLVVLRGLPPNDGRTPEGAILRHWNTLKLGATVTSYVASTFTSGVPAGYLKVSTPNFKAADAENLKAQWLAAHGTGKRSIAVLNATVDFNPISISPVDSDAANLTAGIRTDIAHAFGLSSIWLDLGASGLTYQNNSDRRRDLVDISLSGFAERIMATLTSLLPYGQRVEVDWARFTQPSFETQISALVQAVQTGILTGAEARAYLGITQASGPDPAWRDRSPAVTKPQPPAISQPQPPAAPTEEEVTP